MNQTAFEKKNRAAADSIVRQMRRTLGRRWTIAVDKVLAWHVRAISPCQRIRIYATPGYPFRATISSRGEPAAWISEGRTMLGALHNAAIRNRAEHLELERVFKKLGV